MSMWWDAHAGRYRTSLPPHKFFYVWTWPVSRWVLHHCMPAETAHYCAIHVAMPFAGFVDRLWVRVVYAAALLLMLCVALLCRLVEECAEVQQRATKAMRFGISEKQPGQDFTNAERLAAEIGDVLEMVERIKAAGLIRQADIDTGRRHKRRQLSVYRLAALEPVARALADVHFRRKQHYGHCTQDECVAYLVERNWRNHLPDAEAALRALPPSDAGGWRTVDIVFDGPPSHEAPRFVEVESPPGTGIRFGEWVKRDDGYWVLRFVAPPEEPQR